KSILHSSASSDRVTPNPFFESKSDPSLQTPKARTATLACTTVLVFIEQLRHSSHSLRLPSSHRRPRLPSGQCRLHLLVEGQCLVLSFSLICITTVPPCLFIGSQ
ncbi:hypothetical protein S245_018106, partial [Arachis hypogaea]